MVHTSTIVLARMTAIYFDLDGTLTDPKPGITRSIQYALRKLDRVAPAEDELTWCIGPPLRASLKKLVGADDLADKALLLYRERFADIGVSHGGTNSPTQYRLTLGWDLPMLRRLRAIRACVDGEAARLLDRLLGPIEEEAKRWKE